MIKGNTSYKIEGVIYDWIIRNMKISEKILRKIHRIVNGDSKTKRIYSIIGLPLFLAHIALFFILSLLLDKIIGFPELLSSPSNRIVSVFFIGTGLFLIVWSMFHFFKQKGTPVPFNPPPKLVLSGPYRYSRNPMICGWFLVAFGIGFLLNSIAAVSIGVPLFILFHLWEIEKVEEPELEERFGEEYIAYKRSVGAFFPKVKIREK